VAYHRNKNTKWTRVSLAYFIPSELLGSWTLFIVRNSKYLENTTSRKLDLFPSSGEGRETSDRLGPLEWLRLALSKGPNSVGVSIPTPYGVNRTSSHDTVVSSYLEFRTTDKVQKRSDSKCYTQVSETTRFFFIQFTESHCARLEMRYLDRNLSIIFYACTILMD
jgi:hypothetical protein